MNNDNMSGRGDVEEEGEGARWLMVDGIRDQVCVSVCECVCVCVCVCVCECVCL